MFEAIWNLFVGLISTVWTFVIDVAETINETLLLTTHFITENYGTWAAVIWLSVIGLYFLIVIAFIATQFFKLARKVWSFLRSIFDKEARGRDLHE